jgi:hypothetical protein
MAIPGLPPLPASVNVFTDVVLLTADAILIGPSGTAQWGIFLNGEAVVLADNVVSLEFKQDFSIANYPVEQGAFASYNKVQHPFQAKLRFSTGGSVSDRQAFLDSIAAIIGDTNLYTVMFPEGTYPNVNLTHQGYDRTADKAGLISVDVWCEEVRPSSTSQSGTSTSSSASSASSASTTSDGSNQVVNNDFTALSSSQSPTDMPQVNGGNVQPQAPTTAQQSAASSVLSQSMTPGLF